MIRSTHSPSKNTEFYVDSLYAVGGFGICPCGNSLHNFCLSLGFNRSDSLAMTKHVFKGAGSAAFYSHIDCRSDCDMAHTVGLFHTYALVAWRYFDRSDGLDGKTYAHIGR